MATTLVDFHILALIEAFDAGHTDSYLFRASTTLSAIPPQLSTLNPLDAVNNLTCRQPSHNSLEAGSDILFLCHGSTQVLHNPQSCCLACLRRTVSTLPEEQQSILTHYTRMYVRLCKKCGSQLEQEKGMPVTQKCTCPPALQLYLRNDNSRFWSERLQDDLRQPRRPALPNMPHYDSAPSSLCGGVLQLRMSPHLQSTAYPAPTSVGSVAYPSPSMTRVRAIITCVWDAGIQSTSISPRAGSGMMCETDSELTMLRCRG